MCPRWPRRSIQRGSPESKTQITLHHEQLDGLLEIVRNRETDMKLLLDGYIASLTELFRKTTESTFPVDLETLADLSTFKELFYERLDAAERDVLILNNLNQEQLRNLLVDLHSEISVLLRLERVKIAERKAGNYIPASSPLFFYLSLCGHLSKKYEEAYPEDTESRFREGVRIFWADAARMHDELCAIDAAAILEERIKNLIGNGPHTLVEIGAREGVFLRTLSELIHMDCRYFAFDKRVPEQTTEPDSQREVTHEDRGDTSAIEVRHGDIEDFQEILQQIPEAQRPPTIFVLRSICNKYPPETLREKIIRPVYESLPENGILIMIGRLWKPATREEAQTRVFQMRTRKETDDNPQSGTYNMWNHSAIQEGFQLIKIMSMPSNHQSPRNGARHFLGIWQKQIPDSRVSIKERTGGK